MLKGNGKNRSPRCTNTVCCRRPSRFDLGLSQPFVPARIADTMCIEDPEGPRDLFDDLRSEPIEDELKSIMEPYLH